MVPKTEVNYSQHDCRFSGFSSAVTGMNEKKIFVRDLDQTKSYLSLGPNQPNPKS